MTERIKQMLGLTEAAEDEREARRRFARRMGWDFEDTGFHASGHMVLLPITHPDSQEGVLAKLPLAKARQILPLHTEHRGEAAKIMRPYVPGTPVIDRVQHPRHKIRIV